MVRADSPSELLFEKVPDEIDAMRSCAIIPLSHENEDLRRATVLDVQVSIDRGNFITKVYNKTDSFPFDGISMPFLESNVCEEICYKVFYSQMLVLGLKC